MQKQPDRFAAVRREIVALVACPQSQIDDRIADLRDSAWRLLPNHVQDPASQVETRLRSEIEWRLRMLKEDDASDCLSIEIALMVALEEVVK
jgi:hypothetical protein